MENQKIINSHILKVSGQVEIENEMELGKEYNITISGQVVKTEDLDNQDGTVNRKYILKPIIFLQSNQEEKYFK